MPLLYPIKRIFRSWKLFIALLIGVTLAATFFAGIFVKANLTAQQSLDQQLSDVLVDMEVNTQLNYTNFMQAQRDILGINGVKSLEMISVSYPMTYMSSDNFTTPTFPQVIYLPNSSSVYNGWDNKPSGGIGENETYVLLDTNLADELSVNDTLVTSLDFPTPKFDNTTTVYLNLTVAGFANLNDDAYSIATGNTFYRPPFTPAVPQQTFHYKSDLLIVDWGTLEKIWSTMPNRTFSTRLLVSLNRDELLNPWDVQTSANNVQTVANKIQNDILANYEYAGSYFQNNLGNILTNFQYNFSGTILINLIIVSLPVFSLPGI
jgi:hypothetical protein